MAQGNLKRFWTVDQAIKSNKASLTAPSRMGSNVMTFEINIYAVPPPKQDCERLRDSLEDAQIYKLAPVIASLIAMAYVFFEWNDPEKMSPGIFTAAMIVTILLAIYAGWRYWELLNQAGALLEAHPETTNAFLACGNSSVVKAYCTSVKNQGRNLTMGEAVELMKLCRTDEEIRKLAEYYDAHNVKFPEYAVH